MSSLPGISVLIPTLNSGRYLRQCLQSIREQDYPHDLVELIVADAGSTDATIDIAHEFRVDRIVPNPLVTGEAARAILNRLASRELILSIDSDNYLVGTDWLSRMVQPLVQDPTVFASEPLQWDYSTADSPLNRYFALTGINDPISLFMGNYGRYSYLTGTWTEMPHTEEKCDGYLVATLKPGRVPTMGANGFMVRTNVIRSVTAGDYYFDIDVVNALVTMGHRRIAKVRIALGHHFADNLLSLNRKTRRRIEDYLYWRKDRHYPWLSSGKAPLIRFTVYTLLVVPLVVQAFRGWRHIHDRAWLYHVPVCWQTLWIYSVAVARATLRRAPHSRRDWQH